MAVALVEVTGDNVDAVCALTLGPGQDRFVASNLRSLAQAYAYYATAWPRAIAADGELVGFLMLSIDPDEPKGRPFYLWRLMVDRQHQRRGHGAAALRLAIDEVRRRGATELFTSWVPGDGSPEGFYRRLGFEPIGEIDEGEIVARLPLTDAP